MALQTTLNRNQVAALLADVAVIRCEGEMGEVELAHIGEELFRLTHRGCNNVVLDLSKVDHVDYRGIGPLATRAKLLRRAGGDLMLCGLTAYVAAIFRAAGVDEEFQMHRTLEDARAAFAEAPALALVRR